MRRLYIALIAAGIVLFLALSALLARAFSADGGERSAITNLIEDEARGDQAAMMARLEGCDRSPSCRARVEQDVTALRHPGTVSILQLEPSTSFSLTGSTGTARVAWRVASGLPIVQCVRVRLNGDVINDFHIQLLGITPRLESDAACPTSF